MKKMLLPLFLTKLIFSLAAGTLADADLAKITSHLENPPEKPWTWVFYGDSITQGAVHTHGWRAFPEIFAECLRYERRRPLDRVINSGISGHTSEELLNDLQYDWRVRSLQPSVVIIMIGMNDIVSGRTPEKFQNNLIILVNRIRSDGAIPILQTSNTIQKVENPTKPYQKNYLVRYEQLPRYMEIVRAVAQEKDVILVDHFIHWSQNAAAPNVLASWLGETIHPGGRGHREIAMLLLKTIGMYSPQSQTLRYPPDYIKKTPDKVDF